MRIVTQYKTNGSGAGQIVAKGGNRQRTVPYNPALSADRNHGLAAGTLALALGLTVPLSGMTHEVVADGRHVFNL